LGWCNLQSQSKLLNTLESFPRRLIRHFREAPEQLFEDIAHLMVGHIPGAQVHFGEHLDQLIEQVILGKLRDDLFELEILDDLTQVLAVSVQVIVEIELDIL
jgi:hypothetical protein